MAADCVSYQHPSQNIWLQHIWLQKSVSVFVCIGRQRRAAEAKLDVAKEVSHENGRLQDKLHSYRKEVRQLESSCHARSQEAQVLQAQLRYQRCIHLYLCLLSNACSVYLVSNSIVRSILHLLARSLTRSLARSLTHSLTQLSMGPPPSIHICPLACMETEHAKTTNVLMHNSTEIPLHSSRGMRMHTSCF